jgi:hypothetical protein
VLRRACLSLWRRFGFAPNMASHCIDVVVRVHVVRVCSCTALPV